MRGYLWVLAVMAAPVLQSETPAFAAVLAYASDARASYDAGVTAERRCKRAPKEEVCDWVKSEQTQKKSR
jgi:hypothetical protein